MSKSKTLMTGSNLLMAAIAGTAAWLAFRRPAKAATKPKPLPTAPSPFVEDSHCTLLADAMTIQRWVQEIVEPLMRPQLEAYAIPLHEHEAARAAIEQLVDQIFGHVLPKCIGVETSATRLLWKALWCEVVAELVRRGKIDDELDDILRRCLDPAFDPRAPKESLEGKDRPLPPRPPIPRPIPGPSPEPMDGTAGVPPPNLWTATTREELSEIGLMRMMEGTLAGAPIKGPKAHTVLLAHNPAWPGLEQARAELRRLAVEHPNVTFIEVSFVDSQRHFGKPKDLYGLMWVLTATAPDGRVFPNPIVRDDPRDEPPSAEHWAKVLAHASGFVGARRVRRVVKPQRFGDFVLAMVPTRRTRSTSSTKSRPTKARPTKARRGRARSPG